jgi:hypothetical protein
MWRLLLLVALDLRALLTTLSTHSLRCALRQRLG